MVLMGMGNDDALQVLALVGEEADVWQHQVDTRQVRTGKCHPAVNHDPLALAWYSVAIEGEVHADFAHPTEGEEHQFFLLGHNVFIPFFQRIHHRRQWAQSARRPNSASAGHLPLCHRNVP